METALSEPLVDAATGYFGSVPRLFYLDVWVTRPNIEDDHYGSQLYHLDKMDDGMLSLFVNVSDVDRDCGPLTFIPANVSRRIREGTDYERIDILGDGRLTDEMVFAHCSRDEEVEIVGRPGTGGFVDTSRCLHAGSRCKNGERVIMVIRYCPAYREVYSHECNRAAKPAEADPIQRLLLA
jgi:hypothetical protein